MYSIRDTEFIRYDHSSGRSVNRLEIDVDSASDLPAIDAIDGILLYQGSIAWDISTGDFYGLKSDGTWYKQDGTGAYDPENSQTLNSSRANLTPNTDLRKSDNTAFETVADIPEDVGTESEVTDNEPLRDSESR